jgi:uncharacterized protein (TIGR02217 family)
MFDFSETRLDLGMPLGKGGPSYRTIITRNTRDFEKRHMKQPEWLFSGDVGQVLLFAKQIEYLTAFFNARKGKAQGFRYKWWADYKATAVALNLGDGASTQGVTFPLTGNGATTVFALRKRYTWAGQTTYKTIKKLAFTPSPKVFVNGTQLTSGFIFNYDLGSVGFATPPASGAVITWEGEFDLPVRFDIDYLPGALLAIDGYGNTVFDKGTGEPYYQFSSIPLVELVQPVTSPIAAPLSQIDREIDLGTRLANGGYEYRTEIIKTESAYEAAFPRRRAPLYKGDFGSFVAVDLEVDYLLCVFNVLRGRATGFLYKNLQDYRATHNYAPLPPLGGSQGIVVGFVGDGVKTQFQLAKQYENNTDVTIKPVFSAVSPISVKVGGVTTAATLFANGIIEFASPPVSGQFITWEGEFRLPVRLDADKISLTAVYLDAQPTLLSSNSFDSCDQQAFKVDGLDLVEYPVGQFAANTAAPSYLPCAPACINLGLFSDGTFSLSTWSSETLTAGAAGTASMLQAPSGGNPGLFLSIVANVPASVTRSTTALIAKRASPLWTPSSDGAIQLLSFSFDARIISGTQGGVSIVLIQSGKIYGYPGLSINSSSWTAISAAATTQNDFVRIGLLGSGVYNPDFADHPDFSPTGAAIRFGVIVAAEHLETPPYLAFSLGIGIDNLSVTLCV